MSRKSRTCGRRIWLNGVALVEQTLVVESLQEIPQSLDIFVVVGDIWVVEIYPIAHLSGEVAPHIGVLHHILTATTVVLLDGNLLADILLGDAESLLNSQLHRQTVCVPTRLAVYAVALLCLVAAEDILDGTSHYVVNTRHTICRRGTFVEDKRWRTFACLDTFGKSILLVPFGKYLVGNSLQIEVFILLKLHKRYIVFILNADYCAKIQIKRELGNV